VWCRPGKAGFLRVPGTADEPLVRAGAGTRETLVSGFAGAGKMEAMTTPTPTLNQTKNHPRSLFMAVLLMRCPRCREGAVFRGLLLTNRVCQVCGLEFERENGYFTGAMYISYFLGIVTTAPVWLTLLLTEKSLGLIIGVTVAQVVVSMPIFYHYSRVLWLHFDMLTKPETFVQSEGRHPRDVSGQK